MAAVRKVLAGVMNDLQSGTSAASGKSSLLRAVMDDLGSGKPIWKSWDEQTYEATLECIKVLSRSQSCSSYLATTTGIRTLQYHAQNPPSGSTSTRGTKSQQLAISAICNTLLLHASAPEICCKEGLGDWALRQLDFQKAVKADDTWSFLMARVIMVLTSRADYGFLERFVDELSGLQVLEARLQDAVQYTNFSSPAVVEYLKVLYHVFALYPEHRGRDWDDRFDVFSALLVDFLLACPSNKLESPMTNIINLLTRLPPESLKKVNNASERLVIAANVVLDVAMAHVRTTLPPPPWKPGDTLLASTYDQRAVDILDETLPPAFLALVNLIHADPIVRRKIKNRILPPDLDRSAASGLLEERADALGYLLRFARSSLHHVTAAAAGELLYLVCGDAASFSDEIGYGNAAGILFQKGMGPPSKPEATIEEIPDAESCSAESLRNPITGLVQETDEPRHPLADMSQEEKEREAEKIMALFDRMEKNPAMRLVENPMKDAVRSGKIDEWERSEGEKMSRNIREQEAQDEAEAAKEVMDWKKRMRKA